MCLRDGRHTAAVVAPGPLYGGVAGGWARLAALSFRARLALLASAAVAVAVLVGSIMTYVIVSRQMGSQVDAALRARAETIQTMPFIRLFGGGRRGRFFAEIPDPILGEAHGYVQLVRTSGELARPPDEEVALPVSDATRAVAAGERRAAISDARVRGVHIRIVSVPLAEGWALQVARPLTETDRALGRVRVGLTLVALCGVGFALVLGLLVTRTATAPLRALALATDYVRRTGDLSRRIASGGGRDELGRLAANFDSMLEALAASARAQQQLVADASHELRTPLTSLRLNAQVLASEPGLPDSRRQLIGDVIEQVDEMTVLITNLTEIARAEHATEPKETVDLAEVAAATIERAQRDNPALSFESRLQESPVLAVRAQVERAVMNLVDNAAKWSPPGAAVEVATYDGTVEVRDHGPGIAADELPFVFDRFYRAAAARSLPGSGLGLAIVKQVADAHAGHVEIDTGAGEGTTVRLHLRPDAA